jgi:hypothetical protein
VSLAVGRRQDSSDQGHAIVEGDAAVEDSGDADVASVSAVAACAEVFQLHGDGGGERAYAALVQECSGSNIVCLGENTYVWTITMQLAAPCCMHFLLIDHRAIISRSMRSHDSIARSDVFPATNARASCLALSSFCAAPIDRLFDVLNRDAHCM